MKGFRKYLAEFIGTGVLVFVACGVAGQVCDVGGAGHLMTALAFGLVIVAMAYSIGNVSGCHINPAVSLAMLISKKMSVKDFIGYVIAQYLGATAGAGLLYAIVKNPNKLGANALAGGGEGSILISLAIEAALTFVFVLAILGVTSKESNGAVAGLVIGGALVLVHLLGIPFTGTSVNPARTFGPALFNGSLSIYWVFLVAPLVGGALAAVVYKFLAKED
jgi:aquaporin Z